MNCYDCASTGVVTPAIAVCDDCGAGVCIEHAVVRHRRLTRTVALNRQIEVEPPARLVRCETCTAAHDAARRGSFPTRRHAERHAGAER